MSLLNQSRQPYHVALSLLISAWVAAEKEGTHGNLNAEEKRVIAALKRAQDAVNKALEG